MPSLILLMLLAGPLPVLDFDTPPPDDLWKLKVNTTIDWHPAAPQAGAGALGLRFAPGEFNFGWVHRGLPEADYTDAVGITGYWRAPTGQSGQITMHVCLAGENTLSYFRADLGRLEDSDGRWLEFYAPLSGLRYERGPIRQLTPAQLGPNDLLQLLVGTNSAQPVVADFDTVRFVAADEGKALSARAERAADERFLLTAPGETWSPHPRLLLSDDALPVYKARYAASPEMQAALDALLARADSIIAGSWPDDPLGPIFRFAESSEATGRDFSAPFEGVLVQQVRPFEQVAAAYQFSGQTKYAEAGRKALVKAAGQLTAQTDFLDKGFFYTRTFYVRALAFAYDWLYDTLSPDERRLVQTTLVGFVRNIHDQSQSATWGKRPLQRVWNWDPGLMSACGLALLAIEGETRLPERSLLFDCRRHVRDYLTLGIDETGCGHEGPSYLGYGIGAGPEFIEVLRRRGWGDLLADTNYQLIPPWLISETLPDGRRWNNLSDCGHGQAPWSVYQYAAARLAELAENEPAKAGEAWPSPDLTAPLSFFEQFQDRPGERPLSYATLAGLMAWAWRTGPGRTPPTEWDGQHILAHLLLARPLPESLDPTGIVPLGVHFRGRGLVVARTGFGPDDLHLAIEAGPHAAGHDQGDKGTFTLVGYGADLAVDSGYGNDGDDHKSGSSYAHNVVLIDGQGQPIRWHNQSGGSITSFAHSPKLDWTRVDAREAWNWRHDADLVATPTRRVRRAERSVFFMRPDGDIPPYVVVYDSIDQDGQPHDYTWQWHIPGTLAFQTQQVPWVAAPRMPRFGVLTTALDKAAGSATWRVTVPGGKYRLYGLAAAGGLEVGKSDSFFVQVDGGAKLTWDLPGSADLAWSQVFDRGDPGDRVFELAAGEHTIVLSAREPQAEFGRWALVPDGTAAPNDPDGDPAGAILLELTAAQPGNPAFLSRPPGQPRGPLVSLDVTPVTPTGGTIATDWFETSREGSHPRLQYTVKAVDPHFLMVLLPRREGVPRPVIAPLQLEGGVGCEIRWPGAIDRLVFANEAGTVSGDLTLSGSAGFVRERAGQVADWALMDGDLLTWRGQALVPEAMPGTPRVVMSSR